MQQYLVYGIFAAVACFAIWIAIKSAIREAKEAAEATIRAQTSEDARQLQEEMADEVVTPNTADEVKDKFRKGEI